MTIHPRFGPLTANGNVRVVDLLTSIAKQVDRIASCECMNRQDQIAKVTALHGLAKHVRRIAEAIEKDGKE